MGTIVVGVDGSAASRRALRWAADEAGLRGAGLQAVMAWEYEIFGALPGDAIALPEEDKGPKMREHLEGIVRSELGDRATDVEARPVYGSPSEALIEAGSDADLIVVGSRGMGGFKRLLLGSVSSQVVHHAHVPVVIIPAPADDDD